MENEVQTLIDTIHYLCSRAIVLEKEGNSEDAALLMKEAEDMASELRVLRKVTAGVQEAYN